MPAYFQFPDPPCEIFESTSSSKDNDAQVEITVDYPRVRPTMCRESEVNQGPYTVSRTMASDTHDFFPANACYTKASAWARPLAWAHCWHACGSKRGPHPIMPSDQKLLFTSVIKTSPHSQPEVPENVSSSSHPPLFLATIKSFHWLSELSELNINILLDNKDEID